jgi:hypothetical protein
MTVILSNKPFTPEVESEARFEPGQKKRLKILVIARLPIIFT